MDSVFECGLCSFLYDEHSHKPLSLPCGHVFCQECLTKFSKDFAMCPTDKFKFDMHVANLPCCFTILANLPKLAQKDSCCVRHPKKKVKFLCKSHDKFLCTECIIDHTGMGHSVVAFSVNTAVIKSDLKELEQICENTIKENEESKKEIDHKFRQVKDFYHAQISKINTSYENALKILQGKKKEHISMISKYLSDQCRVIEKHKDGINRMIDNSLKVLNQLKILQTNLPHYESLCLTIKSLKQELKYLEMPIDTLSVQYYSYKASEPFTVFCSNLEEVKDMESEIQRSKSKLCSHQCKQAFQVSVLNEIPLKSQQDSTKTGQIPKALDKSFTKPDENATPDNLLKPRQNLNPRNHQKRMPWKKRNKSL